MEKHIFMKADYSDASMIKYIISTMELLTQNMWAPNFGQYYKIFYALISSGVMSVNSKTVFYQFARRNSR